jgi:uncharacterized protein (TIGR02001 family)
MSKMIKSLAAVSVMAASTLSSAAAMAEVSMNIGATSNYIWRGVTQTADEAAISGGLDYEHESGLYAGVWTSSLGNADAGQGAAGASSPAGAEFDYYAGFGGAFGDFGYDVNVTAITYPQLKKWDFTEVGVSGSYSFFTVGLNRTISSSVDDTAGAEVFIEGDMYYYVSASAPVAGDLSVGATFGSYKFQDDGVGGAALDYNHYQLSVTKSAGDFGDVTLAYDKNDMDNDPATDYKEDSGRISVSWAKSF